MAVWSESELLREGHLNERCDLLEKLSDVSPSEAWSSEDPRALLPNKLDRNKEKEAWVSISSSTGKVSFANLLLDDLGVHKYTHLPNKLGRARAEAAHKKRPV